MDAKVRQLPFSTSTTALRMGIQILLMHTNPSRTHLFNITTCCLIKGWQMFRASDHRHCLQKTWSCEASPEARNCWASVKKSVKVILVWSEVLKRPGPYGDPMVTIIDEIWWHPSPLDSVMTSTHKPQFQDLSLRGFKCHVYRLLNKSYIIPHINKYNAGGPPWPSSECPWCPSFCSSDASTWRWPRQAQKCSQVLGCLESWVAGPLRAEWLMTSRIWCWFELISSSM